MFWAWNKDLWAFLSCQGHAWQDQEWTGARALEAPRPVPCKAVDNVPDTEMGNALLGVPPCTMQKRKKSYSEFPTILLPDEPYGFVRCSLI